MQHYKAIIFDLDGTLLDTLEDLANAGNRVLASLDFPSHPIASYRYFVGDGMKTLVQRTLPEESQTAEMISRAMALFEKEYGENWDDKTALYPGIAQMLDTLSDSGIPLSILSNKPDAFTKICVGRYLHQWHFAPMMGQLDGVAKKPDPAGALLIAEKLQLQPQQILYVGDTSVDMRTATSAGMDAVGVLWGFRPAEELQAFGARYLIETPAELCRIIRDGSKTACV